MNYGPVGPKGVPGVNGAMGAPGAQRDPGTAGPPAPPGTPGILGPNAAAAAAASPGAPSAAPRPSGRDTVLNQNCSSATCGNRKQNISSVGLFLLLAMIRLAIMLECHKRETFSFLGL